MPPGGGGKCALQADTNLEALPYAASVMAPTSSYRDALVDVHPQTGVIIEVFYTDRTMETFGRCGAGWFWWSPRRGIAPSGLAAGPFPTSYAAYRDALVTGFRPRG